MKKSKLQYPGQYDTSKFSHVLNNCLAIAEREGKSASAIAGCLGINKSTLSRYRSGKATPSLSAFVELSQMLGVSTDYLLGLSDEPSPNSEAQGISRALGLDGTSQATIKQICNDTSGANNDEIFEYWEMIKEPFFENFTGKRALNYILSDCKNLSAIIHYLKTYMLLYTVTKGFRQLPENSIYRIVPDNHQGLRERNLYYFFMMSQSFQRLVENAAKRMIKEIDLSTEEAAKAAGIYPNEASMMKYYGVNTLEELDELLEDTWSDKEGELDGEYSGETE